MSDDWIDELRSEPVDTDPRPGFMDELRAELQHEWENESATMIDSPTHGRRRWAVAAAAASIAALVVGLVTITAGDDAVTPATVPDRVSTSTQATTSNPSTTTATATPAREPIAIGPATEFVAGDGVVLGAYIDDAFVSYSADSDIRLTAPALPDDSDPASAPPAVSLLDRTGEPGDYYVYDEGCGAIVVSPTPGGQQVGSALGWQRTVGRSFGTLDGATQEENPEALDDALAALGLGDGAAEDVERLTPQESLDADSSLETMLFRYDTSVVGSDQNVVWFAIWDPDTAEIRTIAGRPTGGAKPFATNGEGPIDVDGDGNLETTITTGLTVELVRLTDGATLARARRCPDLYERSAAIEFVGDQPSRRPASVFGFGYGEPVDLEEVLVTVGAVLGEPDADTGWRPAADAFPCSGDDYRSILWDDLRLVLERWPGGLTILAAWSVGDVDLEFSPPLEADITASSGLTSVSGLGVGSSKSSIADEGFAQVYDAGDHVEALAVRSPFMFETTDDRISGFSIERNDCTAGADS